MNKVKYPRMRGSWTELETEVKYSNPWIEVSESKVINPNGGEGIYGVVKFKNLAIGVIPIDEEGYTWLVGQERYPFEGKFTWEIVEGGGPLEVDPIISAQRELLEETGLKATEWVLIQQMDLSNSATTEVAMIFTAKGLTMHEVNPDETEKLLVKRVKLSEVYEMVKTGEIVDSLSVAGILKLQLMNL